MGSPRHSCNRKPRRSVGQRHYRKFHQGRPRPRHCAGYARRPDPGPAQPSGATHRPRSAANGPRLRRTDCRNAHRRRCSTQLAGYQENPFPPVLVRLRPAPIIRAGDSNKGTTYRLTLAANKSMLALWVENAAFRRCYRTRRGESAFAPLFPPRPVLPHRTGPVGTPRFWSIALCPATPPP